MTLNSLRPPAGSLHSAQDERERPTTVGFVASDLNPQADYELLGTTAASLVPFSGALRSGAGLQNTWGCIVYCLLRLPGLVQPPQTLLLPRTPVSPSIPLTPSVSVLGPGVSGFPHSPQRDLRSQGFPSQLFTTPDRGGLGTGYPGVKMLALF